MNKAKPGFKNLSLHILFIFFIGAIGVQTLASCSSDDASPSSDSTQGSEGTVKKAGVSGVSQKGPFTEGATITLYELDKDLVQTGRSFKSAITDDKGSFNIRNIELVSPYAMFEVNGFYRNENTGNISAASITLFAIADLREKDNINVNILTHLEYYRVLNLVESGMSVAAAKKQAQKEIFAVFGINSDAFKDSEDMSIFGNSDGDAALLAISVLLQGSLSEGEFSQRLANFSQSIRSNGTWSDEAKKAELADWASGANLGGVRSNILGWGLASVVPDFEKYVYDYWVSSYGLGVCGASNESEIKKSNRNVNYICKNGNWVIATEYEKDVYQFVCSSANEGEIKAGNVTSTEYVCKNTSWVIATEYEKDVYQWICSSANEGEIKKGNASSKDYICENNTWRIATNEESDVQSICLTSNNGEIKKGNVSSEDYICKYGSWKYANYKDLYCSINDCNYFTDSRDDQRYVYVTIGEQTWMAENLNYNATDSKCYNDNSANCDKYGGLYNWSTAMNVCPSGWHLPTDAEWDLLVTAVDEYSIAGPKLKAATGWNTDIPTTDEYGFSALPGGFGHSNGICHNVGHDGNWWSATEYDSDNAYLRNMDYANGGVYKYDERKSFLFSVRCLQDYAVGALVP